MKKHRIIFDINDSVDLIQNLVIHPEILNVLGKKVTDAIKKYAECLEKANRRQENNACDAAAESEICDI